MIGDISRCGELATTSGAQIISSAQMFTLANRMFINAETLASLQILRSELHPNSQTQNSDILPSGLKENLSVYGLFKQLACTPQGKLKLQQIFLQPMTNLTAIMERQRAISLFASSENEGIVRGIQRSLGRIQDMRKVIERLKRGAKSALFHASADHGLWRTLQKFSVHVVALREAASQLSSPGGRVESVERVLNSPLLSCLNKHAN